MDRKAFALFTVLLGISLLVSGCVAVVAAAGGAGGYAWSRGKLSFTTSNDINTTHDAAITSLTTLDVKVTGDTTDSMVGRIKGLTATGEDVTIDLEPQSLRTTKVDIRVGFWGDEAQSQMIADEMQKRLR